MTRLSRASWAFRRGRFGWLNTWWGTETRTLATTLAQCWRQRQLPAVSQRVVRASVADPPRRCRRWCRSWPTPNGRTTCTRLSWTRRRLSHRSRSSKGVAREDSPREDDCDAPHLLEERSRPANVEGNRRCRDGEGDHGEAAGVDAPREERAGDADGCSDKEGVPVRRQWGGRTGDADRVDKGEGSDDRQHVGERKRHRRQ
mmetsp:Transcript_11970/g.38089  ORF Transcript_11970/g.38089 Transcript_11970/m.38089 type:complete len:201 (+) Transcript_11970:2303-2905(+)